MNAAVHFDAPAFAEAVRERDHISPQAFGEYLRLSQQRLAELAGVHRTTLTRAPESEKVQHFLRDALSVVSLLLEYNGGDLERAVYWYKSVPLVELGGNTAEQFVAEGKVDGVRRYIRSLSAGATG